MSPSIEIDSETFEYLKNNAEPFVDTPATVLRRLLGFDGRSVDLQSAEPADSLGGGGRSNRRKSKRRPKSKRAPRGSLLAEDTYEAPLLRYLAENDRQAPSREVVDAVGLALADELTEADKEELDSGEIRWRNRTAFVRLRLVERGDLDSNAPRGTWRITDQGLERVKKQR